CLPSYALSPFCKPEKTGLQRKYFYLCHKLLSMRKHFTMITRLSSLTLLVFCLHSAQSQTLPTLKFIQYAIWGGSAAPNSYKKDSGVLFNNTSVVQGNIGSNHLIEAKNNLRITGSL